MEIVVFFLDSSRNGDKKLAFTPLVDMKILENFLPQTEKKESLNPLYSICYKSSTNVQENAPADEICRIFSRSEITIISFSPKN